MGHIVKGKDLVLRRVESDGLLLHLEELCFVEVGLVFKVIGAFLQNENFLFKVLFGQGVEVVQRERLFGDFSLFAVFFFFRWTLSFLGYIQCEFSEKFGVKYLFLELQVFFIQGHVLKGFETADLVIDLF